MSTGDGSGASASSTGAAQEPTKKSSKGTQKGPLGDRYTVVEELGRGGFGQTYLAQDLHRYNELCVVKEFVPQVEDKATLDKAKDLFEREASVLYQLSHKQIPEFRQLLEVESETGGRLYIVQDYEGGPTYQSLLEDRKRVGGKFSETEITQLLYQVLPVLSYIHGMGLVHRDISPENLILRRTDGLPVLIDFGSVKKIAAAVRSQLSIEGLEPAPTRIGKVGYVPQEQLSTGEANAASDLYGLAASLLVLATGESPQTLSDPYHGTWQGFEGLSPKLSKILKRMLASKPEERFPNAEAVLAALKGTEVGSANNVNNFAGGGDASGVGGVIIDTRGTTVSGQPDVDSMYPPVESTDDGLAGGVGMVGMGAAAAMGGATGAILSDGLTDKMGMAAAEGSIETYSEEAAAGYDYEVQPAAAMIDAGLGTGMVPGGVDSAADQAEQYTPTQFGTTPRAIGKPDRNQALLGLLVLLGLVGTLLLFALTRLINRPAANVGAAAGSNEEVIIAEGNYSQEEIFRKQEIESRRESLGIGNQFFTRLVDQLFYQEYPELLTSGPNGTRKSLSSSSEDEPLRIRWDHIASDLLGKLERDFNPQSVRNMGNYSSSDESRWRSRINAVNVGTRSLYDIVDAKFFSLFANQSGRDFLQQPTGQLYYALADDTTRAIESGDVREEIRFDTGTYSKDISGQLSPGSGRLYTMALSAGQLLRLNLSAPAESTQLSLYLPEPTEDIPAVFADSEQTVWSGSINQTGVYELVVINRYAEPINYQLAVSVDNVSSPPVAPPPVEDEDEAEEETGEDSAETSEDNSQDGAESSDSDDQENSAADESDDS